MTAPSTQATAAGRSSEMFRRWVAQAVRPRLGLLRLVPSGGLGHVAVLTVLSVLLGLLPVAFVLATSALIGGVPLAVEQGVGGTAWDRMVQQFLLATGAFLLTQALSPVQAALGHRLRRRVDSRLRDQAMAVMLQPVGIGPVEDQQGRDDLAQVTRTFERDWCTPGQACYGLITLLARYTRLLALVAVVCVAVGWPAGTAVGAATLLFRYGQRGGLRKYSQVERTLNRRYREAGYFHEMALTDVAAKESRVFGLNGWLVDRYEAAARATSDATGLARRRVYLRTYRVITPLGVALVGAALAFTGYRAASGQIGLAALALATQAIIAAVALGDYYPESDTSTQYAMFSVDALARLQQRFDGIDARQRTGTALLPAGTPTRDLTFDRVTFSYPGSRARVLDDLQLTLPAGRCTAIVGVNGAGKTTLVKLLTRLYEPAGGSVRVDGLDIADVDPVTWRRQVAVIFQDFVRYEMSAADNIALGAPHIPPDPEAVQRAAERAGIADALLTLPAGLDTTLSRAYPGGTDLSGGQWQRIAIARALFAVDAGARVLVLDEPTAALDIRAETAFFDSFVELTRGVTSLLISHRFSSVRRADHIAVLDDGRVVEMGTHAELMAAGSHYSRLFALQAERFARGLDAEDVSETDGLGAAEVAR